MGIFGGSGVSAGETKEGFLRPAQHGPELAAENAVRAANDLLQHSLLNSLAMGSLTKMRVQRRHVKGGELHSNFEIAPYRSYLRGVTPRKEWPDSLGI
jgi:hypothetical protein